MTMQYRQDGMVSDVRVDAAPTPNESANPRYYVRAVDGGGQPVGAAVGFQLGNFPRELTGGDFGVAYRFVIRACNVWSGVEVCGPYSDPVTAPAASITFEFQPEPPSYDGTTWTWSTPPQNGALTPRYFCGASTVSPDDPPDGQVVTANSCRPGAAVAPGDAGLYVQIDGRGHVYRG